MRQKQKSRLRLREYSGNGKKSGYSAIEQRRREFDSKLQELSKKKAKISEELRQISSQPMNLSQISGAGMLAHYAVLAVLLGALVKSTKQRFYEKELEKLGNQNLDYETKLEELTAFNKAIEATEKAFAKYEKSSDSEKETHYDEFRKLSEKRDSIAERLGLSSEEFTAIQDVIKTNMNMSIEKTMQNLENSTNKDKLRQV